MLTHRPAWCAITIACAVPGLLLAGAATASADGWGTVDCTQTPTPRCALTAGNEPGARPPATPPRPEGHTAAPATGGGSDDSTDDEQRGANRARCGYRPSRYRPPAGAVGSGLFPSGTWLEGVCSATGVIGTPVLVPTLSPAEVARLARSQLGLPRPRIAASPSGVQLVNLPTWLWLAGGWEPATATASVPGLTVTATARPRVVVWSMGDGGTVTCRGPGTPFRSGVDPRAASPDCGHTYRRSSAAQPNQAFPVSATVRWSVAWAGAGRYGTVPDLTITATTALRVAESQALNASTPQ